jgi:hypothetical protein
MSSLHPSSHNPKSVDPKKEKKEKKTKGTPHIHPSSEGGGATEELDEVPPKWRKQARHLQTLPKETVIMVEEGE